MKSNRIKFLFSFAAAGALFFHPVLSFAFVTGTYRCLFTGGGVSGSDIDPKIGVTFGDSCSIEPPFFIHVDGTYSKSSEKGTWSLKAGKIIFSESKIRGSGKIDDVNNQITFEYINPFGGRFVRTTYYLVAGTEEGTVDAGGAGKTITPVNIKLTLGQNGFIDPEKGDVATLTFKPASSGKIEIKVFSPEGRLLDSNSMEVTAGVETKATWNGRTKDGNNPVASGIYYVHIEGGGVNTGKVIAVVK